ncbi:MAG: hypothetical protein DME05_22350, partial [Candidatus Rokuibacteriota bacterium]
MGRLPEPRRPLSAGRHAARIDARRRRHRVSRKLSIPILGQGDPNRPKDIHLVGRYALGVDWTDGHGSIYPFEFLRRACACGACAEAPATAAAPRELKKLDEGLRVVW